MGCFRWISHHRSIIWIKVVWNRGWVIEIWCKTQIRYVFRMLVEKLIWVLRMLVGKLIWVLIIVGILVAKWVIRRILGVELIIIGIHFTKYWINGKRKANWKQIIRLREWKIWFFFLCPNQMIQVSIYREKKIMNFGKKIKK